MGDVWNPEYDGKPDDGSGMVRRPGNLTAPSAPRPAWEGLLADHAYTLERGPGAYCRCGAYWRRGGCTSDAAVAARGWRDADGENTALAARVAALEGALRRVVSWATRGVYCFVCGCELKVGQPHRLECLVLIMEAALRDGPPAPTTEGTPDPDVWEPLGIPGGYVRKRAAEDVGG